MKTIVIYDSWHGNTQKITEAIAKGISGEVRTLSAKEAGAKDLDGVELLVLGSPVHGGRPSEAMLEFMAKIPNEKLKGVSAACFDTRFEAKTQGFGLKALMSVIGYAADKMVKFLETKGAKIITPARGFIVTGKEGPIKEGELAAAEEWGRELARLVVR